MSDMRVCKIKWNGKMVNKKKNKSFIEKLKHWPFILAKCISS